MARIKSWWWRLRYGSASLVIDAMQIEIDERNDRIAQLEREVAALTETESENA